MNIKPVLPPPLDATDAQKQAYLDELSKQGHLTSWRQPLLWEWCVRRHWRSAELLYERAVISKEVNDKGEQKALDEIHSGVGASGETIRILGWDELEVELIQDFFLMAGYALECAYKGYLFGLLPELISDADLIVRREFQKCVLTHDLSQLCHECGITASVDESKILDFLTYQIENGKYPAPKKMMTIPRLDGDLFAHKPMVEALVHQAWGLLRSQKHGGNK